ncbi:hypothetical protein GQ55_8G147000 [Panicum hallii var. hallii]|uniref:Uncharacterized protein n=1 Tax=Panicum hallii var. hallii TaxID=1504633 RepID=A0A2T7CN68_9POAL|nr:hypothetical protein GQ55_8G147000 [Panicum hallii var. hallii]
MDQMINTPTSEHKLSAQSLLCDFKLLQNIMILRAHGRAQITSQYKIVAHMKFVSYMSHYNLRISKKKNILIFTADISPPACKTGGENRFRVGNENRYVVVLRVLSIISRIFACVHVPTGRCL